MIKIALATFPLPWLMALALALFLGAFAAIYIRASSRAARGRYARIAHLPLSED